MIIFSISTAKFIIESEIDGASLVGSSGSTAVPKRPIKDIANSIDLALISCSVVILTFLEIVDGSLSAFLYGGLISQLIAKSSLEAVV